MRWGGVVVVEEEGEGSLKAFEKTYCLPLFFFIPYDKVKVYHQGEALRVIRKNLQNRPQ